MAQDRLEEYLQAVVTGENARAVERGRWIRFQKGKISERIQQRFLPFLSFLKGIEKC
jgi:hypothetical protein